MCNFQRLFAPLVKDLPKQNDEASPWDLSGKDIFMDTSQIKDVRKGCDEVTALYLGKQLIWSKSDPLSSIPQPENLLSLYTISTYDWTPHATSITHSTGVWTDYITKNEWALSRSCLSNCDIAINPGVMLASNSFRFNLPTTGYGAIYLRLRIAIAQEYTSEFVKLTDSNYGLTLYHSNAEIYARKYSGISNSYEEIPLHIDPFEYHTFAFVNTGVTLALYVDGQFICETAITKAPQYLYFYCNFDDAVSLCFETIAIYQNIHSAAEVANVSDAIGSKYSFSFTPYEQGLLLYDHGNLCEAVSGGWATKTLIGREYMVCELGDDCIRLNGFNNKSSVQTSRVQTNNLIDFTPYKYLCFLVSASALISELYYHTSSAGTNCGYCDTTDISAINGRTKALERVSCIGGKKGQTEADAVLVCMDISAVSGSFAPYVEDTTGVTDGTCARVYKVWLA